MEFRRGPSKTVLRAATLEPASVPIKDLVDFAISLDDPAFLVE
jgi:hypothetical protein